MKSIAWTALALWSAVACATTTRVNEMPEQSPDDTGAGGQPGASSGEGGIELSGVGGGTPLCDTDPAADADHDGFTAAQGDCNDCDPNTNPNAVEVVSADAPSEDEDCDGVVDELDAPCDDGMDIADDPVSAAHAVELCKASQGPDDWGLVSATWVQADGSPPPAEAMPALAFHRGHGILPDFGPQVAPRVGKRLLALSSGTARRPTDPGWQSAYGFDKGYTCAHPPGFPIEFPGCSPSSGPTGEPHDAVALELTVRVPSNAHGLAFELDFYTYEWPEWVCSQFNDFFVALLSPAPPMQPTQNISFDAQGNPISVNNALLDVCGCPGNPPNLCLANGKSYACASGNTELLGTGFGIDTPAPNGSAADHGATGWLVTQAPVQPSSEITLRWSVYDSGDGYLDSTVLLDAFRWIASPGVPVETTPVRWPK